MRNWRVLTAIAAVVLAALAGVLVWKYTENAKDDAKKPYTFESVLVAKSRIPTGTAFSAALDGDAITRQDRVRNDLPDATITGSSNDQDLKTSYGKLVASHDITPGQTLVSTDFVGQGAVQNSLSGGLENDNKTEGKHLEAITVSLDDQHAVGGFLSPGDKVNVIISGTLSDKSLQDSAELDLSTFLIPGLKVIAVGNTTGAPQVSAQSTTSGSTVADSGDNSSSDTKRVRSLITFEVTPRQALQIVQGQQVGKLYLSLNPPSFKAGDFKNPGEIVESINLFDPGLEITFAVNELDKINKAILANKAR